MDPTITIERLLSFDTNGRVLLKTGKAELGQGIYNAMAMLVAEQLNISSRQVDVIGPDTGNTLDEGFTAGSLSVATAGFTVECAAAAARQILLAALSLKSARWIDTELSLRDGAIYSDDVPTGEDIWSIAPFADFDVSVAEHASLKPSADYALLGRPGTSRDLTALVTGGAFIQDVRLPGMLHARMFRPPHLQATIDRLPPIPPDVVVVRDGAFVGIMAEREERVVKIAERIAGGIGWALPDCVEDPHGQIDLINDPADADGIDVCQAGATVGATVFRKFVAHASIGLACAIACWSGDDLTVWTHSQGVYPLRRALAKLLGIAKDRIRVIHLPGAGCYGHNGADDVAADAALMAQAVPGRPVRVLWSRVQELSNAPFAPAMRSHISAGLDGHGRIARTETRIVSYPHARRPDMFGGINLLAGYLRADRVSDPIAEPPREHGGGCERNGLPYYDIPEKDLAYRIVHDDGLRTSAMRTLGAHVNVCAIEAMMDDCARSLDVDPLEFRLRHLTDERARKVLARVADMAGWPLATDAGIGFARYKNIAAYCAVIAQVSLANEVRVEKIWCAVDAGRAVDLDGLANQIEGGILQGISWTLIEQVPFSGGLTAVDGWESYPILGFDQVPAIEVDVIHLPNEPSLGVGEASSGPAAAAVANAVASALGIRIGSLPISRDAILTALG